jgi:cytosine/adenosine deaminase-related metal-dependent hydrolase
LTGATLIRGRYVVTGTGHAGAVGVLENGAVVQRGGRIVEVGAWSDLSPRYADHEIIGSDDHVVLPGFVNAHHHVGLTPVQLGVADDPLELWFVTRMAARDVDPYLDTLYSAFEMLRSGVTTVQHIYGWARRDLRPAERHIEAVLRAYRDVGMRVSFALGVRDQNYFTYEPEADLLARLPAELAERTRALIEELRVPLSAQLRLFDDLVRRYRDAAGIAIQLAPGNLHWCSDEGLAAIQSHAERSGALLHVHLVETAYQREYARRRTGGTALRHLQRFGMTGPHLTLGHGTWLAEADLELAAQAGVHICHNCSSNLRLRSGIAPWQAFAAHGLNVALGIDEAGINDDRDMLQEMRLALHLHRTPGMEGLVPAAGDILAMATGNGARTTPFGDAIGELAAGKEADIVTLRWSTLAAPYLDAAMPPLSALVHRATPEAVDHVMVGGRIVVRGGEIVSVDRRAALEELARGLAAPPSPPERERRRFAEDLLPYVRRYYDRYFDPSRDDPFYRYNARD